MAVTAWGRGVALGMAAAMLLISCADDKESSAPATTVAPATTTTLSQAQLDEQKAQRIVLTVADLAGYTVDPPDPSADRLEFEKDLNACVDNNPVLTVLGEDNDPRGAESANFSKGENVILSSAVTFADSVDQARSVFVDAGTAPFPGCLNRAFLAELRREPAYTNTSATSTRLPALTVGEQSLGFRTAAKFRTAGTNITLYVDFTFVRVGRAVAVLQHQSVGTAFPEAERVRLLTLIAGRMAAP